MAAKPQLLDWNEHAGARQLQQHLRDGGIALLATDTVPGLAISAAVEGATALLAACKGSDPQRPFSLHLRHAAEMRALVPAPPPGLARWLARKLPGPYTVVLPRAWVALPAAWEWPWPAVGLRLPAAPEYLRFCAGLEQPLLMTSANPPGQPPLYGQALASWLEQRPQVAVAVDLDHQDEASASTVVAFDPLPQLRRGSDEPGTLKPGLRVLVVCSGNTCRSPLAAAMLRAELAASWGVAAEQLAALGWVVESAGTYAMDDSPASEGSMQVAAEIGLDLGQHRARHLARVLGQGWDVVLGMGANHLAMLPRAQKGEWFDLDGDEVADPFGGGVGRYRAAREHLQQAIEERLKAWSLWP